MDDALRLRHRMIPYLHTMNWRASRTGLPLVEPMYWGSPDIDAAYHVPNEYMFGTELLAAPITEPMDKSSRRGKADVWLPQGDWFDFFTGRRYSASSPNGRRMTVWRPLDGIPVFAKAGGIVSEGDSINSVDNPQHLEIIVFPGADGDFTLMEDSGHYSRQITPATTAITYRWRKDGATSALTVSPAQGDVHALPARRTWDFLFRGITDSDISVQADGASVDSDRRYDAETLTLQVTVADVSTRSEIRVTIGDTTMAADPRMEDVFDILRHAEMRYLTKEQAYAAIAENGIDALATMDSLEHVSGPDMELLRFAYAERRPSSADGGAAPILARMSPLPEYATGEATAARHRPMSRHDAPDRRRSHTCGTDPPTPRCARSAYPRHVARNHPHAGRSSSIRACSTRHPARCRTQ